MSQGRAIPALAWGCVRLVEFDEIEFDPSLGKESRTGQMAEHLSGEVLVGDAAAADFSGGVVAVSATGDSLSPEHEVEPRVSCEATEPDEPVAPDTTASSLEDGAARETEAAVTDPLGAVQEQLSRILDETEKFNTRASQREGVIDSMHAELERLRRGERRSVLRPLVSEVCRVRDDILRQAEMLPEPFDPSKAVELLRSFAASLELALEDNGIASYAPDTGDAYEARVHRASGKTPTADPDLTGKVATVLSPGYRDIEGENVIAAARVTVFVLDESASASAEGAVETPLAVETEPEPSASSTTSDAVTLSEPSEPAAGDIP